MKTIRNEAFPFTAEDLKEGEKVYRKHLEYARDAVMVASHVLGLQKEYSVDLTLDLDDPRNLISTDDSNGFLINMTRTISYMISGKSEKEINMLVMLHIYAMVYAEMRQQYQLSVLEKYAMLKKWVQV